MNTCFQFSVGVQMYMILTLVAESKLIRLV